MLRLVKSIVATAALIAVVCGVLAAALYLAGCGYSACGCPFGTFCVKTERGYTCEPVPPMPLLDGEEVAK